MTSQTEKTMRGYGETLLARRDFAAFFNDAQIRAARDTASVA